MTLPSFPCWDTQPYLMLKLLTPHHCHPSLAILHFLFQVPLRLIAHRVVDLLPRHQALHVGLNPPGNLLSSVPA